LLDEKYADPNNTLAITHRVMAVLGKWVAGKNAEQLFLEGQARHCPYGLVLPIEVVGENPQLQARKWWVNYRAPTATIKGPGAPYHFSATLWSMGPRLTQKPC
jgi:crotonobetainyl-CoA:carnitine CoA-transferase CaiB-like acyl-CoA transferase